MIPEKYANTSLRADDDADNISHNSTKLICPFSLIFLLSSFCPWSYQWWRWTHVSRIHCFCVCILSFIYQ